MEDVIIIGGSFAGLTAATQLGRARRKVVVLDTSLPRNRFADAAHGVLGHDGRSPWEIRALAEEQLAAYKTVRIVRSGAKAVTGALDNFTVETDDGQSISARRIILAYGVVDQIPDLPGFAEAWGKSLVHCPYCHGFEHGDQRLGYLLRLPEFAVHFMRLIRDWSADLTLFTNGHAVSADDLAELERRKVKLVTSPVTGLEQTAGQIGAVSLADGSATPLDALFAHLPNTPSSDIATRLGCAMTDHIMGPHLTVDAAQQTTVPGIYAAGDITRPNHSLTLATADGVMAGVSAHQSMLG